MPPIDFTQWGFLYAPMDVLLTKLSARIVEFSASDRTFFGGVMQRDRDLVVVVNRDMNQLKRDAAVRSLLANWFGVEITDMPAGMCITELEPAA